MKTIIYYVDTKRANRMFWHKLELVLFCKQHACDWLKLMAQFIPITQFVDKNKTIGNCIMKKNIFIYKCNKSVPMYINLYPGSYLDLFFSK